MSVTEDKELQLGIRSSIVRELSIRPQLKEAEEKAISFGNTFLDASLFGILPNDLILIGAGTGVGKTALSCEIAKNVAQSGKRVLFIALEAEQNEIEMRIRYQYYAKQYFTDSDRDYNVNFDYRNYRYNRLADTIMRYEDSVNSQFVKECKRLKTYYRTQGFNIETLKKMLEWAKDNADLVIIDHLHYFDFAKDASQSSNQRMSDLVKQIRDLNLFYNVPIVLVAHLRKDIQTITPSVADFMGSSDIGKVATTAIMLSRQPNGFDPVNQTSKTIISIPKGRTGSIGVVGIQQYAIQYCTYEKTFNVGIVYSDKVKTLKSSELPYWAKNCQWCVGEDDFSDKEMPY